MDSDVKIVVVGCGGMANTWVKFANALPNATLVGLVDLNRAAAEAMAKKHELPASIVFDTLKHAVEKTGANVVFDVTIPAAHDKVTIEALELGCHVLGEKPMSDALDKAQRMVAAAKRAGRLYGVTQTRRPIIGVQTTIKALCDGAIGDIQEVHSDFYIGARFGGFRAEMDYPLILDMAIHTFDNARQISGADPVSVYCHSWNPRRSWYKGDASAMCVFEMKRPDGSPLVYTYRGSWTNEGFQTDWNADWRIVGGKGTLRWNGGTLVEAETVADDDTGFFRKLDKKTFEPVTMQYTGHEYLIRQFVDAVAAGRGPEAVECPCEDNIKSLAMVLAAVESARKGQPVAVEW